MNTETVASLVLTPQQIARYQDVMVTIIEGGSNYWAEFRNIKRSEGKDWHYESFEMHDAGAFDERDLTDKWQTCDVHTIARGIEAMLNGKVKVSASIIGAAALLRCDPENADDDAEIADCIVQAGLYGSIVFG